MTLGSLIPIIDPKAAANLAQGMAGFLHSPSTFSCLLVGVSLVHDMAPLAEAAVLLAQLQSRAAPGLLDHLRQGLEKDPVHGLKAVIAQAPHHPEILEDIMKLVNDGKLSHFDCDDAVGAFGVAAIPVLESELRSGEVSRIGNAANHLMGFGRLAANAVDALWSTLTFLPIEDQETRQSKGGASTTWAGWRVLDLLATIGGDLIAEKPDAVDVLTKELFSSEERRAKSAQRILLGMGSAVPKALIEVVAHTRDQYDIGKLLCAMGPAAWPHIPDLLKKNGFGLWLQIHSSVGAPPPESAFLLADYVIQGDTSQDMLDLLFTASLPIRIKVADHIRSWWPVAVNAAGALRFIGDVAAQAPENGKRLRETIALLRREIDSRDADVQKSAFDHLMRLLPVPERDETLRRAYASRDLKHWATFELLYLTTSKDPERRTKFRDLLEDITSNSTNAKDRDLAREALGWDNEARREAFLRELLSDETATWIPHDVFKALVPSEDAADIHERLLNARSHSIRASAAYDLANHLLENPALNEETLRKTRFLLQRAEQEQHPSGLLDEDLIHRLRRLLSRR